jgi:hypothetical protein
MGHATSFGGGSDEAHGGDDQSAVGVGISTPAVIPTLHTAQCRYFFRHHDYRALAPYFDAHGKINDEAREEYREKDPKHELLSNFRLYGGQLQLRQLVSLQGNDPSKLLHETLEMRQLVRALHVFQKETMGMYFAQNTMEAAIHDAVDAVMRGAQPGLYPMSGAKSHINPTPGSQKRAAFEGRFAQPRAKRAKTPFAEINPNY